MRTACTWRVEGAGVLCVASALLPSTVPHLAACCSLPAWWAGLSAGRCADSGSVMPRLPCAQQAVWHGKGLGQLQLSKGRRQAPNGKQSHHALCLQADCEVRPYRGHGQGLCAGWLGLASMLLTQLPCSSAAIWVTRAACGPGLASLTVFSHPPRPRLSLCCPPYLPLCPVEQIQGKNREAVAEAGQRMGLEGTYISHSYIELVQLENLTTSFQVGSAARVHAL